jgi:hypothetical protein
MKNKVSGLWTGYLNFGLTHLIQMTPLKNGLTGIKENSMYYVASRNQRGSGGMIIWRHIKKLKSFKATDGMEYVVAKSKKEMDRSLPIYIGVGDKLVKTMRYEIRWLDELIQSDGR